MQRIRGVSSLSLCVSGMLIVPPAIAVEIAPGVTYTEYVAPGPNNIYVVATERLRPEYHLQVGWPQKKRNYTARERTSVIAARYDNPPFNDVLAATNGAFIDPVNLPYLVGAQASDGELQDEPQPNFDTGWDAFMWGATRAPVVRSDMTHVPGTLTFANGTQIPLDHYNRLDPPIHKVTAYTPTWDISTRSSFVTPSLAVEVILENVTYPMRGDKEIIGTVSALMTGSDAQDNDIPPGGMVLTAWGTTKTTIVNNTQVGDVLRMRFVTSDQAYNTSEFVMSGIGWIIRDGAPHTTNWAVRSHGFPYSDQPRTVLAWSETHIYMVVVDGRSTQSVGMDYQDLCSFLIPNFAIRDAINLDGGGSSTMVVNGVVENVPSDGPERPIGPVVLLVKRPTSPTFPFIDAFANAGRLPAWDDKFTWNPVIPFVPTAPGGDGYVLEVGNPAGGAETVRYGKASDTDYTVEADIYCEYRPGVAGDGRERYALFARDSGTAALGLVTYGAGNCYSLMYESDTGRLRAGKFVDGVLTDWLHANPVHITTSGWHRFRIDCYSDLIAFKLDGDPIGIIRDGTHSRGYFGIGHHEFFNNNANAHATRADDVAAFADDITPIPGDSDLDGDVDLDDFGDFQLCLSGNSVPQQNPLCLYARFDGDSDVDGNDLSLFLSCVSGADIPADPQCLSGPEVQVTNLSRYDTTNFVVGSAYFSDRAYTITSLPASLAGKLGIRSANADKDQTATSWITFDLDRAADVYVAYDSRATALPNWMNSYVDTNQRVYLSDTDENNAKLYRKTCPAGQVTLGANKAPGSAGAGSNYFVFIVPAGTGP